MFYRDCAGWHPSLGSGGAVPLPGLFISPDLARPTSRGSPFGDTPLSDYFHSTQSYHPGGVVGSFQDRRWA